MPVKYDLLTRVKNVIVEQMGCDEGDVAENANLSESPIGADSLDHVELIMALEETFDIEIGEDDAEKLTTAGKMAEYVEKIYKKRGLVKT